MAPAIVPGRLSALHHQHLAAGAAMAEQDGWQRPERFGGVEAEVAAARARVAITDLSPMGKLDLKGAGAAAFAIETLGLDGSALGQGPTTAVGRLSLDGHTAPVRLCRLASDHLLLLVPPEHAGAVRDTLIRAATERERTHLTDVTSVRAGIALLGPRAGDVLRKLTALDIRADTLPDNGCAQTALAGVHALLLRADLAEVPVYELYVTRDVAEFVWEALLDAGREYDIAPIGTTALRRLSES